MGLKSRRVSGIAFLSVLAFVAAGCNARDSAGIPAGEAAKVTAPPNSAAMDAAKREDAAAAAQFDASRGTYRQGVKPVSR